MVYNSVSGLPIVIGFGAHIELFFIPHEYGLGVVQVTLSIEIVIRIKVVDKLTRLKAIVKPK